MYTILSILYMIYDLAWFWTFQLAHVHVCYEEEGGVGGGGRGLTAGTVRGDTYGEYFRDLHLRKNLTLQFYLDM